MSGPFVTVTLTMRLDESGAAATISGKVTPGSDTSTGMSGLVTFEGELSRRVIDVEVAMANVSGRFDAKLKALKSQLAE